MKSKKWSGTVWFEGESRVNSYWPPLGVFRSFIWGRLRADEERLKLQNRDLFYPLELPIKKEQVAGLSFVPARFSLFGRGGILIRHEVPVYPLRIVFFCFRARKVLEELGEMGYPLSAVSFKA